MQARDKYRLDEDACVEVTELVKVTELGKMKHDQDSGMAGYRV